MSTALDEVLGALFLALFLLVPWAFLFGILRSRLARGSVAGMMVALEHGRPLREAIAEALGDASLGLAFWLEDERRWVDSEGRALDLENVPSAAITVVEREGRRVGALLHDESLAAEPELVESVTAAAAFAFDNERLQAELRHQNVLLATIVDTAPSLLMTVDTEARIRTLNPATVAASGRAASRRSSGSTSGTSSSTRASARRCGRASSRPRPIIRPRSTRTRSPTREAS